MTFCMVTEPLEKLSVLVKNGGKNLGFQLSHRQPLIQEDLKFKEIS